MKNSKGNKLNIVFSAFLIIGYIICTYFFSSLAATVGSTLGTLIQIMVLFVFGLLLFYATRVGEGKQVKRFSLAVLLLVDLPALLIILFATIPGAPLHDFLAPAAGSATPSIIMTLACVALGYGIPYTFVSGYELKVEDEEAAEVEEIPTVAVKPIEGGLAEELAETEKEAVEEATEAVEEAVENIEESTEEKEEENV